jgi:hypothetical protein
MTVTIPATRDLRAISDANPGWKVEADADGSIRMSPTGTLTGLRLNLLAIELNRWNERAGPYERSVWSEGERPEGFPSDFTSVFDAGA